MKLRVLWLACISCLLFATIGLAASTIKLKDGRTLVGEIRKIGNSYSVVMPDGTRSIIAAADIVTIDGKPVGADKPAEVTAPGAGGAGVPPAPTAGGSAVFRTTKTKADRCDAPVVALQLWDDFIAKNPNSPELPAAKTERETWDKLYKDNAERVKGKWLGGKELKELKKKCDELYKEAVDPTQEVGVRGVAGMKKLDEIIALYPRHFGANYEKGFYNLVQATRLEQGSTDALNRAIKSLEQTSVIAPTVPEVWCNLAIGYTFKRQHQQAIECAWRAVKMREEDEMMVRVLANTLAWAPDNIRNVNPKVREINESAQILFRKYGIGLGPTGWLYLRPRANSRGSDQAPDDVGVAGVQWSGSGFFISADGYIITNHHVAAGDPKAPAVPKGISFRIRMDDGTEVPAEFVAMDDKADIALLKIKTTKPATFLPIADDNPGQGAEALVLGYPATGDDVMTLQISKGTVKSIHPTDEHNVWFDLNTTHGNSGGPIVDKFGHLIAILTGGKQSYNMTIVLGVGVNQIEDFIARIGAKAPKLQYVKAPEGAAGPLDSEKLTAKCRGATVLVLAVRGADTTPAEGDKSATADAAGADKAGDTAGATDETPAPPARRAR